MFPLGDVVAFAIAVVLQADGIHEVCVLQLRIKCFDFVVECHYAALTSEPEKYEVTSVEPLKVNVPVPAK